MITAIKKMLARKGLIVLVVARGICGNIIYRTLYVKPIPKLDKFGLIEGETYSDSQDILDGLRHSAETVPYIIENAKDKYLFPNGTGSKYISYWKNWEGNMYDLVFVKDDNGKYAPVFELNRKNAHCE